MNSYGLTVTSPQSSSRSLCSEPFYNLVMLGVKVDMGSLLDISSRLALRYKDYMSRFILDLSSRKKKKKRKNPSNFCFSSLHVINLESQENHTADVSGMSVTHRDFVHIISGIFQRPSGYYSIH